MTEQEPKGLVFDIVKYMLEDGPGIRTCVFFKGCSLRCRWCSNPLGLQAAPKIVYIEPKCSKCRTCLDVCPSQAVLVDNSGRICTDYSKCTACGECSKACPSQARQLVGEEYTVRELLEIVDRDRIFYRRGGGGVTATGGEILMQAVFVRRFLKRCQERLLSTAIETSGYGRWELLGSILAVTDFAFIDLKHFDPVTHLKLTGVRNELILDNIRKASTFCLSHATKLIIRIPIIPGLNDSPADLGRTAEFIKSLPGSIPEVNLLPYHRYGIAKYSWVGKEYLLEQVNVPSEEHMQSKREIFVEQGLVCTVGGSEVSSY